MGKPSDDWDVPGTARAAVFLDRDGTINENVFNPASGKWEAPLVPDDFRLVPDACSALRALQAADYALILISNQPNFAIGKASLTRWRRSTTGWSRHWPRAASG